MTQLSYSLLRKTLFFTIRCNPFDNIRANYKIFLMNLFCLPCPKDKLSDIQICKQNLFYLDQLFFLVTTVHSAVVYLVALVGLLTLCLGGVYARGLSELKPR